MAAVVGTGAGSARRRVRRGTVLVAVMGVISSYSVLGPVSAASAASLSGSNFEIDSPSANLAVDGSGSAIDWLNSAGTAMRSGVLVRDDKPTGQHDDSFTQGTNINQPNPTQPATITTGSIPNNKSDLTHFGIYKEEGGSDPFINVFWTRVQAPSGTTTMDFEFNQSPLRSNGISPPSNPDVTTTTIPVRTPGDILITYLLAQGGTHPTLTKRVWGTSSWGAPVDLTLAGDALGAINTTAIPSTQSGGLGALDPLTFGEASIRLSAFASGVGTCTTFGSVYLRSRSSATDTDENKDFIAPEPITISNCGTITIHKTESTNTHVASPLAGATFTLYKDVAPTGGSRDPLLDSVSAGTCTTNASGDCSFTNVHQGFYWVVETTVPFGHDAAADQPVSITSGDQVVALNLDDPIQYGTIVIRKVASPPDGSTFHFTQDGNAFTLPGTDPVSSQSFTVPVGSHSVSEVDLPTGWALTGLACVDPSGGTTTSLANATASIGLANGETVTCTFTNVYTATTPGLATQASDVAQNGSVTDTATLTGDGTHAVTGTVTFHACSGLSTAAGCATGGALVGSTSTFSGTGPFTAVSPSYTPVAGWTCFRADYAPGANPYYGTASHTNTTTECVLKQNANLVVTKTATAAFGRTYHWTITKNVDKTRVDMADGAKATFHYTVDVANTHTDAAWTVTGSIHVVNPNSTAFTGVSVTDAIDNKTPGACVVSGGSNATIPANGSADFSYTCTYASTPNPLTGTNTATATWSATTFFTPSGTATGTATVDFGAVIPSTTDEQVTVTDSVVGPLGTVNAITDPNPAEFTYAVDKTGVAGTCTSYDNTATFTTNDTQATDSASKRVTVCVGKDLTVSKTVTASFNRDDLWSITKNVDATKVDIANGGHATFHYTVHVAPNGHADSGYAMSGSIHVANPNDWEAITATVTDTSDVGGGVTCAVTGGTGVSVPAGSSVDLPYSCTFTGAPGNGHNTAHVSWSAATAHTPTGAADATVDVTFTIARETHQTITVVDDKTDPAHPVTLGTQSVQDGAKDYTYSLTKDGVAGACTDYTNTATISETGQSAAKTVTVCVGLDLTVTKTALATDHRTYLWDLTKDVDRTSVSIDQNGTAHFHYTVTATPAGVTKDGWSVTGQITVSNPNTWEDITANVTDQVDVGGGASCSVPQGTAVLVPAHDSVVLPYSCTFASQPADGLNTATATWNAEAASTPHGSATGTADVVFVPATEDDKTITVVDDKTDPAHPVTLGTATWGEVPTVFTYTVDKQGVAGTCTDYTNTASIQQTEQSASKTVTVCVGSGLLTQVTGAGSFDRTYNWLIDKTVDSTTRTINNGQTATFGYTVTVTPNGIVDGNYAMSGSVTVSNPNDWEDVTADVTVASDLGGGVTCAVTGGTGRKVPAGSSLTLPYTCSFTGAPATEGTATATTTWDGAAAFTSTDSADGTAPVALTVANQIHRTINVTDDKTDPANPVALGSWTYDDGQHAFTYSLTKAGVASTCTDYTNVATIVETAQSDSQVVTVCDVFTGGGGGPVVTPPKTGGGGLPFTGDSLGLLARTALSLLVAGLVLLVVSRRRRSA